MKNWNKFYTALIADGFEDTSSTIGNIFSGDEIPEHETLHWSKLQAAFKAFTDEFELTNIERDGGGEGGGEYCYGVIKLGEEYYKAEWTYYSYQGEDFDDIESTITQVSPRKKTITVYE